MPFNLLNNKICSDQKYALLEYAAQTNPSKTLLNAHSSVMAVSPNKLDLQLIVAPEQKRQQTVYMLLFYITSLNVTYFTQYNRKR